MLKNKIFLISIIFLILLGTFVVIHKVNNNLSSQSNKELKTPKVDSNKEKDSVSLDKENNTVDDMQEQIPNPENPITNDSNNNTSSNNNSNNNNQNANNTNSSSNNNENNNPNNGNNNSNNNNNNNTNDSVNNDPPVKTCTAKKFVFSWFRPDFTSQAACIAKGESFMPKYGFSCDDAPDDCGVRYYMLTLFDESGEYDWHNVN